LDPLAIIIMAVPKDDHMLCGYSRLAIRAGSRESKFLVAYRSPTVAPDYEKICRAVNKVRINTEAAIRTGRGSELDR